LRDVWGPSLGYILGKKKKKKKKRRKQQTTKFLYRNCFMTKKKSGAPVPSRKQIACRAAELAISKGGRPFVATVSEWLERRKEWGECGGVSSASMSSMKRDCAVIEEMNTSPSVSPIQVGTSAAGLKFSLEQRDLQSSPLYPRAFSLGVSQGVSCALDTLATNFPDPVSAQLRKDLHMEFDYRAILGQRLGELAANVRQLFVWHYWGGTLSVMWGSPQNETSPMAPVGDWFADQVGAKVPTSACLSKPVTSELTLCPECIGCAARYSGCFDLYVFIHGVRRLSRCADAGGPVSALEVSFLDGARARQCVAQGHLSSDDLANLITYCDALPGLEARASGIRMDITTETARTCCVNAHFKDNAGNTAALMGVLHAMAVHLVPSRVQAAVVSGAPFPELQLFKASLIPFDLDLLSWAAQDVRDGPAFVLPTSAALSAACARVSGRRSLLQPSILSALGITQHDSSTNTLPFLAPHLSACMRACLEALVAARSMERLRRKEVTFRILESSYEGLFSECGHRMRIPNIWPNKLPPMGGELVSALKVHLPSLVRSKGRESGQQVAGEALWGFPSSPSQATAGATSSSTSSSTGTSLAVCSGGIRVIDNKPSGASSESGLNLALISIFAVASSLFCGTEASQSVLYLIPPLSGPGDGQTYTKNNKLSGGRREDIVVYSRAATCPPKHPSHNWVTGVFAWMRAHALNNEFCDPIRPLATLEDTKFLLNFLSPEVIRRSPLGIWSDWGLRIEGIGQDSMQDFLAPTPAPTSFSTVPKCSNCGVEEGSSVFGGEVVSLQLCSACSGVAYCSKNCQGIAWVAGHCNECGGLD